MDNESEKLRRALIVLALTKKTEKIQQKIQLKVDNSIKEWETVLLDYIEATTKLSTLIQRAEEQKQLGRMRQLMKQCTELITFSNDQFKTICELIECVLPMTNLDSSWMANIEKQEARLSQMNGALSQVLLFSCNRDVIEIVQKMITQINDIKEKIKFATNKMPDIMHDTLKNGSDMLNNNVTDLNVTDDEKCPGDANVSDVSIA